MLWVKGSGGDLGSASLDGFASLYLDKLHALESHYRGLEHEDEMPEFFPHCTFNLNPRASSIDTPLHAFIPHRHIDHMHADALIAIAAARERRAADGEIFGGELAWIPWQRPGFDLGLKVGARHRGNPDLQGLILGGHGADHLGPDRLARAMQTTLRIIQQAADWLDEHAKPEPFGPSVAPPLDRDAAATPARPASRRCSAAWSARSRRR